MRTCPYCQSKIEDEARFCLYCMRELEQKTVLGQRSPSRRWAWPVLAAVFGLVAVGIGLLRPMSSTHLPLESRPMDGSTTVMTESTTTAERTGLLSADTTWSTVTTSLSREEKRTIVMKSTDVKKTLSSEHTTTASRLSTTSRGGVVSSTRNTSTAKQTTTAKPTKLSTTAGRTTIPQPSTTTHRETASTTAAQPMPLRFTTRQATTGEIGTYTDEAYLTIISIDTVATDGVYRIPAAIDGVPVVHVLPTAFQDGRIAPTVKKVVIPATVRRIQDYTFGHCDNLTDVYFQGDYIEVNASTFCRQGVLYPTQDATVHSTETCHTGSNTTIRYYAEKWWFFRWQAWDGQVDF